MSYSNNYAPGALAPSDYNVLSHGDIGAFYNSVIHADLPKYTAMFYQPSQHEQMADLKYSKVEIGYDSGLRDMNDAVKGAPIEAYIPRSIVVPDNASASPSVIVRNPSVMPKKSILDEIENAQREVTGKKGFVIVRSIEVEQELRLKRKFKKVEIFSSKID